MSLKYKVGQRVQSLTDYFINHDKGDLGTIMEVQGEDYCFPYIVKFDHMKDKWIYWEIVSEDQLESAE